MIDGVPNRRLYFYQKDTIDPNSCFNKQWGCVVPYFQTMPYWIMKNIVRFE
jgi:hypothetical protein